MVDSSVVITAGSGTNIDTRTESTNSQHRQVVVLGDPLLNANVAAVATQDLASSDQTTPGIVVRSAGSLSVQLVGSTGTLGVHLASTAGTLAVLFNSEPTVVSAGKDGTTTRSLKMDSGGAIKVYDIVTGTINTVANVTNITNSASVHILSTAGTLVVKLDPGYNVVNPSSTIIIPVTVSGSTSGVSVSGVTLISPEAGRNSKIFAFSVQTTGIVSLVTRFTNGAGTSPTEFWRPLVTPVSTPGGANLAVPPPSYLFSTGTNTTLALLLDSATLVHYSVSYFKESA